MSRSPSNHPAAGGGNSRRRRPRGLTGGIPLFRIFGIQIRMDMSWLFIFFIAVFGLQQYFATRLTGLPEWGLWLLAAGCVIALFACVLAHELGHSLVAMRNGVQMSDITLMIFGGVANMRGEPASANAELKIALAGPAVTVVLAAIFWPLWYFTRGVVPEWATLALFYLALLNSFLLAFNMIPGFPLDGGRVLRAILWRKRDNLLSATRTAAAVGKGFGYVLIGFGLWQILQFNLWVGGGFHIFLGWFLMRIAAQSVLQTQLRTLLEQFTVADAMQRDALAVHPDLPLRRLIDEGFYRYHVPRFPLALEGEFMGIVDMNLVQQVDPSQHRYVTAGEIATPPENAPTIDPEENLWSAFRRMAEQETEQLAVVNEAGRLVGMLSHRDIISLMHVHSELRRPGPTPGHIRQVGSSQTSAPGPRKAIPLPDDDGPRQQ